LTRRFGLNTAALSPKRLLIIILIVAAALRLGYVLSQDFDAYYVTGGGDTVWYLQNGYTLVTGEDPTGRHDVSTLSTAPLFLVFVGVWQAILSPHAAMIAILISQALMGIAVVYFAYGVGRDLTHDPRVGLIAAGVLAISPQVLLETARVLTESLFIFLMMAGLWLYVTRMMKQSGTTSLILSGVLTGIAFGLATLTRAVFLLFPFGLVLHLFFIHRTRWLRLALVLLAAYALTVSTWTVYNLVKWDRLVIGGEGIWGFLYQGATHKASPNELDASLNVTPENADAQRTEALQEGVKDTVLKNPVGWMGHRLKELASAYLQPHNTNRLKGKSIRSAAVDWVRDDRTLSGLIDLTRIGSFWPKLLLYVFHFGGLLFGAAGMWVKRREWRSLFPVYAIIFYFTGIHLVLLALPRYLFPTYPAFWVFAAAMIVILWDRWKRPRREYSRPRPSAGAR
jgi:4-amino-4-deoxy-L-arabinose transferase-like glycosyltransferase